MTIHVTEILKQMEEHRCYVEKAQQELHKMVRDLNMYIEYYDDSIYTLENAIYKLKEVTK